MLVPTTIYEVLAIRFNVEGTTVGEQTIAMHARSQEEAVKEIERAKREHPEHFVNCRIFMRELKVLEHIDGERN